MTLSVNYHTVTYTYIRLAGNLGHMHASTKTGFKRPETSVGMAEG